MTEFCHAPEKHNRILLDTDAERSIKENQSETERGDSLDHTLFLRTLFSSDSVI